MWMVAHAEWGRTEANWTGKYSTESMNKIWAAKWSLSAGRWRKLNMLLSYVWGVFACGWSFDPKPALSITVNKHGNSIAIPEIYKKKKYDEVVEEIYPYVVRVIAFDVWEPTYTWIIQTWLDT